MQLLSVVKVGGNVIEDENLLNELLDQFVQLDGPKILIHGGGKAASALSKKMGIEPNMVDGRRITDAETLKIITMVYGGLINKNVVAQLQAKSCNAIGLTGADGNAIKSHKRPVKTIDYGFVGDVDEVNADLLSTLLTAGVTPVFCAITHDQKGQLLNTNADTIASTVAQAMSKSFKVSLKYCFEKNGVLTDINDDDSFIPEINKDQYEAFKKDGTIAAGMIPKMDNSFGAIEGGVTEVWIGKSRNILSNTPKGTRLA